MAELTDLRDHAFDLAIDDLYEVSGPTTISAADGLMANDVLQEYRTITVDSIGPITDGDGATLSGSTVSVNPDGSFTVSPPAGIETIRFSYRLSSMITGGAGGTPVSNDATVLLRVTESACPCDIDGAGVGVTDLLGFLTNWFALDASADFNGTGSVDVTDLLDFLVCWFGATNGGICS